MTAAVPRPRQPWVGFVVAPVVLLLGVVAAIAMIVGSAFSLVSTVSGFEEVPAGTTRALSLSAGEYTIFGEGPTAAAAQRVSVEILDRSGARLPLAWAGDDVTAESDGSHYEAIATVRLPSTDTYRLVAEGPPGTSVSIGRLTLTWFFGLLIGGFVVGGLAVVLAGIILIVTLVRRMRRERAWRAAIAPAVAPAVPPGPPPPRFPPPAPSN